MFQADEAPDTLVLGCTHFPALAAAIRAVVPGNVRLVDSAATAAAAVQAELQRVPTLPDAVRGRAARGAVSWLATDGAARFARVGSTFLGEGLDPAAVEIIDL